ncbi:MAG: GreA/GreB family elongation factor [Victivallales bacterium]|nr:GreA/GreB family elongation factor [Victivallales bacterium]
MSDIAIEDLFMTAAEDASAENLEKLLAALKKVEDPGNDEIGDELELIFGELDEDMTTDQACFCLNLARLKVKDHSIFRKVLSDAIKKILPPYLNQLGFLRALGLRDRDVSLSEITFRYDNMLKLKNNMQIFFKSTKRWGIISDIDTVSASVAVNSLGGGAFAVPLATTLSEGKIFESSAPASKLARITKNGGISSADYRSLAVQKSFSPLDDATIEEIAYATAVPDVMSGDEFRTWWAASGSATEQKAKGRQFFEARSLKELHVLLSENIDSKLKLDDDGTEKMIAFFEKLNPAAAARDVKVMAESISLLVPHGNDEQLREIFAPLINKATFWPEDLEMIHLDSLNIWGTIPAKHVVNIAYAMNLVFSDEYLAAYTTCLPLRCLNTFGELIDDDLLYDAIKSLQMCSCDILLWIWRNRKKHDKELLELVSIEQLAKALSDDDLPKAWTGAQRDLKVQLMDKEDFQKHLLKLVGEDMWVVTSILQTAKFCSGNERQSLLIKLSRLSPELREHLESGAGQKTLGKQATKDATLKVEPLFTSIKSHKALLNELDELVKVHIPENRESLKVARAHGDFRENAEYDAAKERRNFLNRRRDELERDILLVQPMDFEKQKVEEYSIVGSAVTIKLDSGKEEQYFLVGAWDGNPDENVISYKTRMGQVMMHHKAKDVIILPNGEKCTISKIDKLPESVIEKLRD